MEQTVLQIAIQVPALMVTGYIFLRVLDKVMDYQGAKLERLIDAVESLRDSRIVSKPRTTRTRRGE